MLAWLAYLFIVLVWGTTFAAIAMAMKAFTPWGLVGVRFVLGGALAVAAGLMRGERLSLREEWPVLLGTGLLMIFGTFSLMFWAETHLSSGLTAVLVGTQPILFVLMARERLGLGGWIGMAVGFLGVALVAGLSSKEAFDLAGAAAVLLGEALWTAGTLLGKARFKGPSGFLRTGWQMLLGGAPALLLALPGGHVLAAPLTREALGAALYLAVVGSMLAFSAYLYLVEVWPASRVGTYAYLNAPIAVLVGAWMLKEPFTARMGLGALVVLAGVALVEYAPRGGAGIETALEGDL
ncbi:MAG TPA: EamA family transporter [Holophagaceae bacterium]|nr:EamA family transporter [Holophagaceae bacterium]